MKLFVGLGNPGLEYRDTRHNIGFMVVDELARRFGVTFTEEKRWHGLVAKLNTGWLLKPLTYMNDSGRSVRAVSQFYKLTPAETLATDPFAFEMPAARAGVSLLVGFTFR